MGGCIIGEKSCQASKNNNSECYESITIEYLKQTEMVSLPFSMS